MKTSLFIGTTLLSSLLVAADLDSEAFEAHEACYSFSKGSNASDQDYDEAFKWCSKAAEFGGYNSLVSLAELYLLGNGTEVDLKKAEELYRLADKEGNASAQLMAFSIYNKHLQSETTSEEKAIGLFYLMQLAKSGRQPAVELQRRLFSDAEL